MTMGDAPIPPAEPTGRRRGLDRRHPLASPWLTASLALIVVGLLVVNLLVSNLARLPGESPPGSLALGSPGVSGAPSPAGSPTFTRPTPTPLPTFLSYVVRPGDSLNSIAARFETKARSIAWWNRGQHPSLDPESAAYNPGRIEVGWTLVLLPGTIVDEEHPPSPSPGRGTPTPASTVPGATPPPINPPTPGPT
jgi:hypothetical protein